MGKAVVPKSMEKMFRNQKDHKVNTLHLCPGKTYFFAVGPCQAQSDQICVNNELINLRVHGLSALLEDNQRF